MKIDTFEKVLNLYDKGYRNSLETVIDLNTNPNEYGNYITNQVGFLMSRNYILSIISQYSVIDSMIYKELNIYTKELVRQFDHNGFKSYDTGFLKLEYTSNKCIKLYCKPFFPNGHQLNRLGLELIKLSSYHLVATLHPVNINMYYESFENDNISFLLEYMKTQGK